MHRLGRILGALLIGGGVLTLAWALLVWQWQDPFTALYTHLEQRKLERSLDRQFEAYHPLPDNRADAALERREVRADAARFRRDTHDGQAIGRIVIGRLGLNMVLVNGTDHSTLEKGPGRDLRTYMPGENRLVYVAGHRTTYLAPFSHIDSIRRGDTIRLEMPYASFVYRATRHVVVTADDLSVLRSPKHELLALQACHPRFFATHRYIVYAQLVSVDPRGGKPYGASLLASARP